MAENVGAGKGGQAGVGARPARRVAKKAAAKKVAHRNALEAEAKKPLHRGHNRKRVDLVGKMALLANGATNPDTGQPFTVGDMDDEELARMRFRDKNGGFTGRPPANLPRVLVDAMRRELLQRATTELSAGLLPSLEALKKIIDSPTAKDSDKVKAITIYLDRMLGKTPERIEVAAEPTGFENVLTRIMRNSGGGTEDA